MSLETQLQSLISAIGGDVKTILTNIGNLANLTTTDKTSLVLSVNELKSNLTTLQSQIAAATNINDTGSVSSTTETYSISKIIDLINTASATTKSDILDAAPTALDTLKELATALGDDPSFATTMATALGNRVRFDAVQTLTAPQQAQALSNIGAASAADLTTLENNLGDVTADLAALYATAKT